MRLTRQVLISLLAGVFFSSGVFAEDFLTAVDETLDFEITADYVSKYIWRGQNLNDDGAFQPGASVSYEGFSVSWWASVDITNISGNDGEITESDWTFDYTTALPWWDELMSVSVGFIDYHFPSVIPDTDEFYWGFSFDTVLSPAVTFYHDIDEADGTYIDFNLSHSFGTIYELDSDIPVGLDVSGGFGYGNSDYNEFYWGVNDGAFNDLYFSVGFPIEFGGWTFTTSLNYVTLMDSDIRKSDSFDTGSDYFFVGLGLSTSF